MAGGFVVGRVRRGPGTAQAGVAVRFDDHEGIQITLAVATALAALALMNGTANADGTDYYVHEMQRIGWLITDRQHDIAAAKFVGRTLIARSPRSGVHR